jgi:hypothetical protein
LAKDEAKVDKQNEEKTLKTTGEFRFYANTHHDSTAHEDVEE